MNQAAFYRSAPPESSRGNHFPLSIARPAGDIPRMNFWTRARISAGIACAATAALGAPADALHQKGRLLHAVEKHAEAIDLHTQAVAADPHHACAFHDRGACHHHLGQLDAAIRDYQTAIELVCQHVDRVHAALAAARLKQNDFHAAFHHADMAVGLMRDDWMKPHLIRGQASEKLGDPDGAIEDYDAAAEIDPFSWIPPGHRAKLRFEQGDLKRGLHDLLLADKLLLANGPAKIVLPICWAYLAALWILSQRFPDLWRQMCRAESAFWAKRGALSPRLAAAGVRFSGGRGFRIMLGATALFFLALSLLVLIAPLWLIS